MKSSDIMAAIDWTAMKASMAVDEFTYISGRNAIELALNTGHRVEVPIVASSTTASIFPVRDLRRRMAGATAALSMQALAAARNNYARQANLAEARGDIAGADAWLMVVNAIETAQSVAEKAGSVQTWDVEQAK